LEVPRRALAVGAHPDDIEFGAGATLAAWADRGCRVSMLVVTDGSKGSGDPDADPGEIAARRRVEQQASAEVLGASEVGFLDRVDGELQYSMALREEICRRVREARPEVVLSHDPWQRYQLHPDHRVVGLAVVDGVVAARDPLFFPDQVAAGTPAHRPAALLLWSAEEPNHWEDASAMLARKVEALLCHASQTVAATGEAGRDAAAREAFADRVTRRAAERGKAAGLGAAESFRRITP
jgi:LmbE family N-acetylglucosaminyl deacetylase